METGRYNYARDGFVYLLSYATLVIFSVGLNFLLKAITNRFIPDALERYSFLENDSTVIGFLAAVIIAFPIFVYLNFLANKMLGSGRMRHDSGVRTWLLYLTLVVVILIIIWQVIALFISYLNGVLVARFAVHTLITLVIAAAILGYQWWHLKTFTGGAPKVGSGFRVFEWITFIVVVGAVIGTFFIIDSPAVRRLGQLDETRVERLASLQSSIQGYYGWEEGTGHKRLPVDFDELIQDPRVYVPEDGLLDPVTRERFEYRVIDVTTYELCATFDTEFQKTDDKEIAEPESRLQRFYHGVGRECFTLTVG